MSVAERARSFDELYAEIARLPEGVTGEILEPGVVRTMSRPGRPHRRVAKQILRSLGAFDVEQGGRGWWIEVEAEIRLPSDRLVVPDLSGWRVERVPMLPDENPIGIVPYWCCEILSPTTARDDRTLKLPLFARDGVPWIWFVDPELRTVEVFRAINAIAVLEAVAREDEVKVLPPFEDPFELSRWWASPQIV